MLSNKDSFKIHSVQMEKKLMNIQTKKLVQEQHKRATDWKSKSWAHPAPVQPGQKDFLSFLSIL